MKPGWDALSRVPSTGRKQTRRVDAHSPWQGIADPSASWRSGAKAVRSPKFTLPGPPGSRGANRPRTGVRPPPRRLGDHLRGRRNFRRLFYSYRVLLGDAW